jgi:hypothetical protein
MSELNDITLKVNSVDKVEPLKVYSNGKEVKDFNSIR